MPPSVKDGDIKKPPTAAEETEKIPQKSKTVVPNNKLAGTAAATSPRGVSKSVVATLSLEEAIETCKKKVEKIAKECRVANRKYRDYHFDLRFEKRYCLDGLTKENSHLNPAGTLRVEVRQILTYEVW